MLRDARALADDLGTGIHVHLNESLTEVENSKERFGRRPVIIVAVMWFGLLSFACGFAWSYDSLLVPRLLQGLGLGAEVPVAATYISELARAGGRGRKSPAPGPSGWRPPSAARTPSTSSPSGWWTGASTGRAS